MNVRGNINNEIIYIESGKWPLSARIKQIQLKFWLYVNEYSIKYPESALSKVLNIGLRNNLAYLKYYQKLKADFSDPSSCQKIIEKGFLDTYKTKIVSAAVNDADSRLGTYYRVNPLLQKYVPNPQNIMEIERELVTRFRTGSHS